MSDAREVTRLRKAGQLNEALNLARDLVKQDGENIWNRRAMGWCLYSRLKELDSAEDIQRCGEEFDALQLPADDEMIHENWNRVWQEKSDPAFREQLSRARNKACPPGEALDICRGLREAQPAHPGVASASAWAMTKCIRSTEDPQELAHLSQEYTKSVQPYVERPGLVHSMVMAAMVSRVADLKMFVSWALNWGLGEFRDEDWIRRPYPDGQGTFPALVEQVAKGLGSGLKRLPAGWQAEPESNQWKKLHTVADWLRNVCVQFPDNIWLPYYEAEVFLRLGMRDRAMARMKQLIQQKSRESWAWHKLALCFPREDERQLACLCKALECGQGRGEDFLLTIKVDAAQAWAAQNRIGEARHLLMEVLVYREQKQWRISEELLGLSVLWADQDEREPDRNEVQRLCDLAVESSVGEDEWKEALLVDRFTSKKGKPMVVLAVQQGKEPIEVAVPVSAFPGFKNLESGSPLYAAVVKGPGREGFDVWSCRERDAALWSSPFTKAIQGDLTIPEGRDFGFVGLVYIPPPLIQEQGAADGESVSGIAIRSKDKRKGVMSWKAVCLESAANRTPF